MSKLLAEQQFTNAFAQPANCQCFFCGRYCKKWAEVRHAIFLCLSCAAAAKEKSRVVNIKSVTLDIWTTEQLQALQWGGNSKFREFLGRYGLQNANAQTVYKSKAAEFYRLYLLNPTKLSLDDAPPMSEGLQTQAVETPLADMNRNQMIQEAKAKLAQAGLAAAYYGGKAYEAIQQKIESGELKQNAVKVAQSVGQTAKNIWNFVSEKITQVQRSSNKQNESRRTNTC